MADSQSNLKQDSSLPGLIVTSTKVPPEENTPETFPVSTHIYLKQPALEQKEKKGEFPLNSELNKENCPCGDEAHKNLEEWYKSYRRSSAGLTDLLNDKFDQKLLESKIQELLTQTPVSQGYCARCQTLLDSWPDLFCKVPEPRIDDRGHTWRDPYQQPHFENAMEMEAGYRNGCQLCTLFVQCSINRGHPLETWYRLQNRLTCMGKATTILISLRDDKTYYNLTLTWPGLTNSYWLPANPLYCEKAYNKRFTLGEGVAQLMIDKDTTQLALAKKWLESCSATHEACKSKTKHALPTRLIDVAGSSPRLIQSSTLTSNPRYPTLSHVWGAHDFLKLTESCLVEFMNALPVDKLTKTFRDAIEITKALGLQYLWIDALCIIQNSTMDWRRETTFMAAVYGGSTINIAATGAIDGTEGCFLKPPKLVGKVHIERAPNEAWDLAPSIFYDSVTRSPLARRAWSTQERLLSPRTLHFSKTELFWECLQTDACESFPEGTPEFQNQHVFHRDRKPAYEIWGTIVRLYTMGKLSVASDKLVAIAGVAEQAHRESGDEYLAGLWRKDIEYQMLWVQTSPGRRLPKGSAYRAPSWSWASVDENGYVYHNSLQDKTSTYHARVVSASTTPLGSSPFGEVTAGTLTLHISSLLSGSMRTADIESHNSRRPRLYSFNIAVPVSGQDEKENNTDLMPAPFRMYPDSDDDDGKTMYVLPILQSVGMRGGVLPMKEVYGLLLLPTGNKKGEFTRVGYFSFTNFDERERGMQERFLKLVEEWGKVVAEEQCAEVLEEAKYGRERFVITII